MARITVGRTHFKPELLSEIRNTLNQELVLGSAAFRKQVETMPGRQAEEKPRGRPRKDNRSFVY